MKISIIIPSLNEGDELLKTVNSILEHTSKPKIEIIVVDDCSDTGKDCELPKGVKLIENETRLGRPESVQKGIDAAKHEAIIILNARMRFTEGWIDSYLKHLSENPNSLVCATCVRLSYDDDKITDDKERMFGASLKLYDEEKDFKVFNNVWNKIYPKSGKVEVCLGASTATTKTWWNHIHGLKGLGYWGSADAFLSIKSRKAGGECYVLNTEIGNIFRENKAGKSAQHYPGSPVDVVMNKITMIYTLLHDRNDLIYKLKRCPGYRMALHWFVHNIGKLEEEKQYIKSITKKRLILK